MCIFTIIRTINVVKIVIMLERHPCNNKRTNSKFKVFATRRHFNVKFGTVFFLTSLAISGKIERFSFRLSRFPTKKFEIFTSQTEAHPGFGKGGGTTEGVRAKQAKGVGFHTKKHLF